MTRQRIAIYHRVMKRENFEVAAKDLFRLLVNAQKQSPDQPRVLYVYIDGHRNKAGGFDNDMFELQAQFGMGFLAQYFEEVHFPLYSIKNPKQQNNDIPERLEIITPTNK